MCDRSDSVWRKDTWRRAIAEAESGHGESSEWASSSLLWVCSSAHGQSQVSVIDANNPSEVLESFPVSASHLLCAASVPGVSKDDYTLDGSGGVKALCGEGTKEETDNVARGRVEWAELTSVGDGVTHVSARQSADKGREEEKQKSDASKGVGLLMFAESSTPSPDGKKPRELPSHIKKALERYDKVKEKPSTALPTIWMGSQNQCVCVHSAVSSWKKCIRRIKMPDSVLSIVHYKGRVFAALASGEVAVFHRQKNGEWDMSGFHCVTIGKPTSSVRCVALVAGRIWGAYRNSVFVFNSQSLRLEKTFAVHPRKESQVRQLVWTGDGVWCSIRLDSTLRLYHATTFAHLQDVDIEPYVSKMLGTSKLGFSFIRITALLVSCKRLWIGTGNGVILSVPLTGNKTKVETGSGENQVEGGLKGPGGLVRVYSDQGMAGVDGSFVPYCNMAQAQLSFHGHKDAVKFFAAVPGNADKGSNDKGETQTQKNMVVVSGGDGYIDFRIGEDEDEEKEEKQAGSVSPKDLSHLIVWEVPV